MDRGRAPAAAELVKSGTRCKKEARAFVGVDVGGSGRLELFHLLAFVVDGESFLCPGVLRVLFGGSEYVADALGAEVGAADEPFVSL
jgi:hypothetical protein